MADPRSAGEAVGIRRPLTPTCTNRLGLVQPSTATHLGFVGDVFE